MTAARLWGKRCLDYLRKYRPIVYNSLLMEGKLNDHPVTIDRDATSRMEILIQQMKEAESITKQFKVTAQLAWVAAMNNIRACAEEIVFQELIYA